MKKFIYPEMMLHIPVCTHKDPKNLLIISNNADLLAKESLKYNTLSTKAIECSLEALSGIENRSIDIIVCELEIDALVASQMERILKDDGLITTIHPSLDNVEKNKEIINTLAKYFKIVMPYNLGNCETALLASKEYHPTADINLHRADMLDGTLFYNCDVHIGSFAMGNYVRKEYLGIIKN